MGCKEIAEGLQARESKTALRGVAGLSCSQIYFKIATFINIKNNMNTLCACTHYMMLTS